MENHNCNPLDRLEFAVSALKGLGDLVAAARDLDDVRNDNVAVLFGLVTYEMEDCARALRKRYKPPTRPSRSPSAPS